MAVDTPRKTEQESAGIDAVRLRARAAAASSSVRRGGSAVRNIPSSTDDQELKKTKTVSFSPDLTTTETDDEQQQQLQLKVSQFIETVEVQSAIVFLVVFDLCSTVLSRHLRMTHELIRLQALVTKTTSKMSSSSLVNLPLATTTPSLLSSVTLRLLDSLSGFTIVFFLIELTVLVFTFRRRFFSHFGYVLDLTVVCACVGIEMYTDSQAIRLLGLLRVWRVFRLVGTLLERERKLHDRTLEDLELEKSRVLQIQLEKTAAEQSLKREYESRAGMERMLQGYKDESDTLREALNIAAQAVAEATMQGYPATTEGYEQEADDLSQLQATADAVDAAGTYEEYAAYGDAYVAPSDDLQQQQQYQEYWAGEEQQRVEDVASIGHEAPTEEEQQDSDAEDDDDQAFDDARDD